MAKYSVSCGQAKLTHPKLPVIQEPAKKQISDYSYNNRGINMITGFGKY